MKRVSWIAIVAVLAAVVAGGLLVMDVFAPAAEVPVPRSSADYGIIRQEQITVAATGTGGSATGSQVSGNPVRGHVYAVHLDFASSISATTDITLTTQSAPSVTLLQLSNYYTDTWYYPAVEQTSSAGAGLSVYDQVPIADYLSASVGQTISSTSVVVITTYWGE